MVSRERYYRRIYIIAAAGDIALLVDTNHPMIHPEFERGLEWAKKALQANGKFCLQVSGLTVHIPAKFNKKVSYANRFARQRRKNNLKRSHRDHRNK